MVAGELSGKEKSPAGAQREQSARLTYSFE